MLIFSQSFRIPFNYRVPVNPFKIISPDKIHFSLFSDQTDGQLLVARGPKWGSNEVHATQGLI